MSTKTEPVIDHDGFNPTPFNGELTGELGNPFRAELQVDTTIRDEDGTPMSLNIDDIVAAAYEGPTLDEQYRASLAEMHRQINDAFGIPTVNDVGQVIAEMVTPEAAESPAEPSTPVSTPEDGGSAGSDDSGPPEQVIAGFTTNETGQRVAVFMPKAPDEEQLAEVVKPKPRPYPRPNTRARRR